MSTWWERDLERGRLVGEQRAEAERREGERRRRLSQTEGQLIADTEERMAPGPNKTQERLKAAAESLQAFDETLCLNSPELQALIDETERKMLALPPPPSINDHKIGAEPPERTLNMKKVKTFILTTGRAPNDQELRALMMRRT